MKLSAHLGTISWSLADKALYVGYGFVQLFMQVPALDPDIYGLFSLLVALNTWIMIVSDGSALQGVIQFGSRPEERGRVHVMAMSVHLVIVGLSAGLVFLFQHPLSTVFGEPRFAAVASMLPLYCALTIPRMFCLKLLYRDLRMRDLFVTDAVWFGVRTVLTLHALHTDTLRTLDDIIRIDFIGMAASSLSAMIITRKQLVFGRSGSTSLIDYLRFGVPLAVATGLNSMPRQLDVFIIQAFFGAAAVGVYNPAKNLYRFFEQAFDAAVTLVYPAAVRLHTQARRHDLQILITKAISITMVPVIVAVIVLELGASQVIIPMLGPKYAGAVTHFNVLCAAALAMPFLLMSSVLAALGKSTAIVAYSAIGLAASVITLLIVGYLGLETWVGLGIVVNSFVVGALCVYHVRREVPFPWSMTMRAFADGRHFMNVIKKRIES